MRSLRRPPELFWDDAVAALQLDLRMNRDPTEAVPRRGPLIVIANHPFGVVDGLLLGWTLSRCRSDFQIMTHRVLYQAPEVRRHILPIDFSGSDLALTNNLSSRRQARIARPGRRAGPLPRRRRGKRAQRDGKSN